MSFFQSTRFIDEAGVPYGIKHINNKPRVSAMPYTYDIAENNVPNHQPWSKLGFNADVDPGTEDIWTVGGTYVPPAAEQQMEVISSSANDAAGGTGVRSVTIYYLTSTYVEKSETIALNGLTAVPTVATDIYRINGFRAATVGSNGSAVGNVDIRNLADTPIYSRISTGFTRARNSFYTVPDGKVLYVTSCFFTIGGDAAGKDALMTMLATYDERAAAVRTFFMPFFEAVIMDGSVLGTTPFPLGLPEGVDIKVRASNVGNNNTLISSTMLGWLETA